MTEGMPESSINVDAPSYPAEIGNEAYRLEQQAEAGAAQLDQYSNAYSNSAASSYAEAPQQAARYVVQCHLLQHCHLQDHLASLLIA